MVAHNKLTVADESPRPRREEPGKPGVYATIWTVLAVWIGGTLGLMLFAAMCGVLAAVAVRTYLWCMG